MTIYFVIAVILFAAYDAYNTKRLIEKYGVGIETNERLVNAIKKYGMVKGLLLEFAPYNIGVLVPLVLFNLSHVAAVWAGVKGCLFFMQIKSRDLETALDALRATSRGV